MAAGIPLVRGPIWLMHAFIGVTTACMRSMTVGYRWMCVRVPRMGAVNIEIAGLVPRMRPDVYEMAARTREMGASIHPTNPRIYEVSAFLRKTHARIDWMRVRFHEIAPPLNACQDGYQRNSEPSRRKQRCLEPMVHSGYPVEEPAVDGSGRRAGWGGTDV